MKKTCILILGALAALTSCGMIARSSSSDNGHMFDDGIYGSRPTFRTEEERKSAKAETEALVSKTKESPIYLFGDKKDTIMIPENFSARIQYDQKVGGTVITVGENPFDWRWDLENRYGYYYSPYSIGSSWYWSRHYSPYWSSCWSGWGYSPWYYGGFYDPWYIGGYWGGFYGGFHTGFWGWHDPWYYPHYGWHHHVHHPVGGPAVSGGHRREYVSRVHTERSNSYAGTSVRGTRNAESNKTNIRTSSSGGTMRGGMSIGNRVSRATASANRSSSAPAYRRPASATSKASSSTSSGYSRGSSSYNGSSSSDYDRSSSSGYNRSSSNVSNYSRSSSYSSSGSYSRSSSYGGSGGGYSRSSSGRR